MYAYNNSGKSGLEFALQCSWDLISKTKVESYLRITSRLILQVPILMFAHTTHTHIHSQVECSVPSTARSLDAICKPHASPEILSSQIEIGVPAASSAGFDCSGKPLLPRDRQSQTCLLTYNRHRLEDHNHHRMCLLGSRNTDSTVHFQSHAEMCPRRWLKKCQRRSGSEPSERQMR